MKARIAIIAVLLSLIITKLIQPIEAQEMPPEYQQVLKTVAKSGDYKSNVLKVNIPRNDIHVTIDNLAVPTPFGFGGWFALTKGDSGDEVMMGELVLLQEEVNPVMSALLDNGRDVTALHNHLFWKDPRIYYMRMAQSTRSPSVLTM